MGIEGYHQRLFFWPTMQANDQKCSRKFKFNLKGNMTASKVWRSIVRQCVLHIRANEAGVSETVNWNPESLHQMRIALRRLRTAFGIFRQVLSFPEELKREIKWLDEQLGAARDWDVLSESTLPDIAQNLFDAGIDTSHLVPLIDVSRKIALEKRILVSTTQSSARYAKLLHRLNNWQPEPLQNNGSSLKKASLEAIQRNHKKLRRFINKNTDCSQQSLHRLRIIVKKCHYTADFLKSLFPGKRMRKYITRMARKQDILGAQQDVTVANRLLDELLNHHPDLADSICFARGFLAARMKSNKLLDARNWKKELIKPIA